VASFKPAYLIHGDDHARIGERRGRLRAVAEEQGGSLELLEGEAATPDAAAAALCAMTLTPGRRFVIVDGAETWKEADLDDLERALAALPDETTVAFFGREDGRRKVPARLAQAVEKAGGVVQAEAEVKPWDLPGAVREEGGRLGLRLDAPAAKVLVARVGERRQRLSRELEKLALELRASPASPVDVDATTLEEATASSAERKTWTLADAVVAGDAAAATRIFLELTTQGERPDGLLFTISNRVRQALGIAERLEAGESAADVRRTLRMPQKAAAQLISDVERTDPPALRRALTRLADLQLQLRGGATVADAETATLRAIGAIAR
jgi:DNA polymerase-3 subunit delta